MIQSRPKSYQARCVAASYRAYRAKSLGGHDREIRGFTWVHQSFSYCSMQGIWIKVLHCIYSLLCCWERDLSNSQAVGKGEHRPKDPKIQKAEFFGIVIAAKATWIGRCFIEDMDSYLRCLTFAGHIAFELRPFCELHAAVSKPQNWRDKNWTRQWNHQKDRKNRIWWHICYSDVYMHRNAVDETLRPIDDFVSIGA